MPDATRPPLEFAVTLPAPPKQVFAMVLGEPERWLCRQASVDLRPGGTLRWCWPDGCAEGRVLLLAEPSNARFSFRMDGDSLPETMVALSLATDERYPARTALTLQHYGFGMGSDWDLLYLGCARAWAGYLKNLRSVIEAGLDLREPNE